MQTRISKQGRKVVAQAFRRLANGVEEWAQQLG
jgi:hypothetical protein